MDEKERYKRAKTAYDSWHENVRKNQRAAWDAQWHYDKRREELRLDYRKDHGVRDKVAQEYADEAIKYWADGNKAYDNGWRYDVYKEHLDEAAYNADLNKKKEKIYEQLSQITKSELDKTFVGKIEKGKAFLKNLFR